MVRTHRLLATSLALVVAVALGGCTKPAADPGFAGHWTSTEWGEHYILVDGTTMRVIYAHDNGRIVGTLDKGTFTGWWTETPSRQPDRDAGEVTFTLTSTGGQRRVDGVWSYGAQPKRENWDLTWVDSTIPDAVKAQLADASAFTRHP